MDSDAVRRKWDEAATAEAAWASRPSLNRSLREREIVRRLDGIRTVLDVGGGPGTFSIPLAKRGLAVTHLDISPAMLELARANARGLDMQFVEGNAVDLSAFGDRAFDLVLNMDGAISGSGADAETVIRETCRVSRKRVIMSMAHQAFVVAMAALGKPDDDIRGFTPPEIRGLIEREGFVICRLGGVGSLGALVGKDFVRSLAPAAFAELVDGAEAFDRDVLPDGSGTLDDTGLFAVADRAS